VVRRSDEDRPRMKVTVERSGGRRKPSAGV
jgi:hypothetical protein